MAANPAALVKLALKHGPTVASFVKLVRDYLRDNPELPKWARSRLADLSKSVDELSKRRGDPATIRKMLERVRSTARKFAEHQAARPDADPAAWVRRADRIELALRIAEDRAKPEQKPAFARLKTEADVLLADVFEALTEVQALPAPEDGAAGR